MCGIVGIRRFDGRPVSEGLLGAMASRLEHRARRRGYWVDGRWDSVTDASRSSTWPARPSRWPRPTGGRTSRSTARSSTTASCGPGARTRSTQVTPRCCSPCTTGTAQRSPAAAGASSPMPSTTATISGCTATGSVSCPVHRRRPPVCVRLGDQGCCCRRSRRAGGRRGQPRVVPLAPGRRRASHTLFRGVRKLLPGHRQRVSAERAFDPEPCWTVPTGPRAR